MTSMFLFPLFNSLNFIYMKFTCLEIRLLRASRQIKQHFMAAKMGITKQRYSELENNPNLKEDRSNEILKVLGYTQESARKYLDSIPNSVE